MTHSDDQGDEGRRIWADFNERQLFEHGLIDRKATWLLTTQALLFAAYGLTFTDNVPTDQLAQFRTVVASAGLLIAALTFIGVVALIYSKHLSWQAYRDYFRDESAALHLPGPLAERPLQWGVATHNTWVTLAPDVMFPIVFFGAWCFVLASLHG